MLPATSMRGSIDVSASERGCAPAGCHNARARGTAAVYPGQPLSGPTRPRSRANSGDSVPGAGTGCQVRGEDPGRITAARAPAMSMRRITDHASYAQRSRAISARRSDDHVADWQPSSCCPDSGQAFAELARLPDSRRAARMPDIRAAGHARELLFRCRRVGEHLRDCGGGSQVPPPRPGPHGCCSRSGWRCS